MKTIEIKIIVDIFNVKTAEVLYENVPYTYLYEPNDMIEELTEDTDFLLKVAQIRFVTEIRNDLIKHQPANYESLRGVDWAMTGLVESYQEVIKA